MSHDPATDQVLYEMLTECTGRALCDSGDAYGRHWEQNQKLTIDDFKNRPETDYEVDLNPYPFKDGKLREDAEAYHADVMPTLDLFHWLRKRLDYAPDLDEHFAAFAKDRDESWFDSLEEWLDHIDGKYLNWNDRTIHDEDGDGLDLIKVRGPDAKKPQTINSYNHECHLSQTIQFTLFTLTGEDRSRDGNVYCALSIHQGCDV